jgi:hypothetical protein
LYAGEEKGPFLRTAKQADNVQRHALKWEVASGHDLMADAVRHGERHLNSKNMHLCAIVRYWSGEQTFAAANGLPLHYPFGYEPQRASELGCEDLSRARQRHRCGPERNVLFSQRRSEICRYTHTIGYGSKGKAEAVEKQVAGELEIGRYCSLRTTVRGRQSTQHIALFIYRDFAADLFGRGLVVVSFNTGGDRAKDFADAWFQKVDAFMNESLSNKEDN